MFQTENDGLDKLVMTLINSSPIWVFCSACKTLLSLNNYVHDTLYILSPFMSITFTSELSHYMYGFNENLGESGKCLN